MSTELEQAVARLAALPEPQPSSEQKHFLAQIDGLIEQVARRDTEIERLRGIISKAYEACMDERHSFAYPSIHRIAVVLRDGCDVSYSSGLPLLNTVLTNDGKTGRELVREGAQGLGSQASQAMSAEPSKPLRPFEPREYLAGNSVETLRDWLAHNCEQSVQLTVDYTIADLVEDLDSMVTGIWNDGIDSMGEDA